MNVPVTRAAEGLPRRAFTVDDISRMMETGIIGEDENFELIEGDLVMMAAKHIGHDGIKNRLVKELVKAAPEGLLAVESSLQLAKDILVEPDITVIAQSVYVGPRKAFARPRPEDVHLVIEIAASSLAYDRGIKAQLYARHQIREFWVIDADELKTWVHTGPSGEAWSQVVERGAEETITAAALPGFSFRLSDIAARG
jgi:Uma2 family endonuclease